MSNIYKLTFIPLVLTAVLFVTGCGVDRTSPEEVIAEYIKNLEHKKYKANYELLSTLSKQYATEDEYVINAIGDKGDTLNIDWTYSYGEPKQLEKDMANPTYLRFQWITSAHTFSNRRGKEEKTKTRTAVTLQNENGKWAICSPEVMLAYGEDKFEAQDYEAVKQVAENALKIDPYSASAMVDLFSYYRFTKFESEDIREKNMYKVALQIQNACPWVSPAYLSLYYSEIGNSDMAIESRKKELEYALDLNDSVSAYCEIGAVVLLHKRITISDSWWYSSTIPDYKEALKWLNMALELDSLKPQTNQWIASTLQRQDKISESLPYLEVAVEDLDGISVFNRAPVLVMYAKALYNTGRYPEALEAADKALTYDPDDSEAQSYRKKSRMRLGQQ